MTLDKIIEQILLNYNLQMEVGRQTMLLKELDRAATDHSERRYNDGFNDAMRSAGWDAK